MIVSTTRVPAQTGATMLGRQIQDRNLVGKLRDPKRFVALTFVRNEIRLHRLCILAVLINRWQRFDFDARQ